MGISIGVSVGVQNAHFENSHSECSNLIIVWHFIPLQPYNYDFRTRFYQFISIKVTQKDCMKYFGGTYIICTWLFECRGISIPSCPHSGVKIWRLGGKVTWAPRDSTLRVKEKLTESQSLATFDSYLLHTFPWDLSSILPLDRKFFGRC